MSRYQLTSFQSGLVVSLSLFGALAGSAAAFVVGDPLGRKRELLLAAGLYGMSFTSMKLVLARSIRSVSMHQLFLPFSFMCQSRLSYNSIF